MRTFSRYAPVVADDDDFDLLPDSFRACTGPEVLHATEEKEAKPPPESCWQKCLNGLGTCTRECVVTLIRSGLLCGNLCGSEDEQRQAALGRVLPPFRCFAWFGDDSKHPPSKHHPDDETSRGDPCHRDAFQWFSEVAACSHVAMIVAFCLVVGLYPGSEDDHLFNAVRRANVQYSMNWFGVAEVGQDDARALLGDAVNEKDFRDALGAGTCVRIRGECKVPFRQHSKTQGRFAYAVITWHAVSFIEHLAVRAFLSEGAPDPRFAPLLFLVFILFYGCFGIWFVLMPLGGRKDDFFASDALNGIPLFCGVFVGSVWAVGTRWSKNEEHLDEIYHFQSIRWLSYGITASIMTAANYAFSWESTSAELLVLTIGLVWSYILCGAASDLLSQVVRHRARRSSDEGRDRDDAFMLCAIRLALLAVGGVAFVASFVPAFAYAFFASWSSASDCPQSGEYAQWLNASTHTCRNHGDFYGGSSSCGSPAMLLAVLTTVVKALSYLHFPFIKMYYNSLLYEETNEMDKRVEKEKEMEKEMEKRAEKEEDSKNISMLQLQEEIAWKEEKHFVFASLVSKMVLTAMFVLLIRYREDGSLTSNQGLPASDHGYLHGTTARYMSAGNENDRSGPPYACNLLQAAGYNYVKSSL